MRAKHKFLMLCKTPELAAEVSLQPVDLMDVDACMIFSDILAVPEAMGMELFVDEGMDGPRFPHPLRSRSEIDHLKVPDPNHELNYVMDALRLTRTRLGGRVPLIGFAGSPWTLAAYMVEGRGSKSFRHIKELVYNNPKDAHALLEKLARMVAACLNAQIEAGAQAIQIFDTWGGILPQEEFREFSLRWITHVLQLLRRNSIPVLVFCKDCGHSLGAIADTRPEVVSLDSTIDIGKARDMVGSYVALQGNMDPALLYATPERIHTAVQKILEKFGKGSGHIFNPGHGVLPDTPVEHAKAFVQAVKSGSPKYHN
jgi:uroporphyrinogen decarboxylase